MVTTSHSNTCRVAIVAENASTEFGGEAFIPFQLFHHLYRMGVPVELLVHERCRDSLQRSLEPGALRHVTFVSDTLYQKVLAKLGAGLPRKLWTFVVGPLIAMSTARQMRRKLRAMVARQEVNIVHQPIPVSPRAPSGWYDLGVPVLMGPMNGNLDYPPAFRERQPLLERWLIRYGKPVATLLNRLVPGKRRASRLLAANERTAEVLRSLVPEEKLVIIPENGVVDSFINTSDDKEERTTVQFVCVAGLLPYKAVDLAIEAFHHIAAELEAELVLVGGGPEESQLKELADRYGLQKRIRFLGHLDHNHVVKTLQQSDVFVFPSLDDCGGAAVLEAMAMALPVVATKWGGPIDYVTPPCGILVEPTSHQSLVAGLSDAMMRLAKDPTLRRQMGLAGRQRVAENFTWTAKVERFVQLYEDVLAETASSTK